MRLQSRGGPHRAQVNSSRTASGSTMSDNHSRGSYVSQELRTWLGRAVEVGASDLHVIVGYPPVLRVHGDLKELSEPQLSPDETQSVLSSLCSSETQARLQAQKNV